MCGAAQPETVAVKLSKWSHLSGLWSSKTGGRWIWLTLLQESSLSIRNKERGKGIGWVEVVVEVQKDFASPIKWGDKATGSAKWLTLARTRWTMEVLGKDLDWFVYKCFVFVVILIIFRLFLKANGVTLISSVFFIVLSKIPCKHNYFFYFLYSFFIDSLLLHLSFVTDFNFVFLFTSYLLLYSTIYILFKLYYQI